MGAWGVGAFENDDALDWVASLVDAAGDETIKLAFHAAEAPGYMESNVGSAALAAAEVVAALAGRPGDLPDDVQTWLPGKPRPTPALIERARKSIEAVLSDRSELKQLRAEAAPDDFNAWKATLSDLAARLAAAEPPAG